MSIINSSRSKHELIIDVKVPFNYFTVEMIRAQLDANVEKLTINMSDCEIVDSEAVIFLYTFQNSNLELELVNPPDVLFTILNTLHLEDKWNVSIIHKNH